MNVNKTWLWLLAVPILAISAQGQPAPPPEGAPPEPALVQTQAVVIAPVELPPAVAEVIRLSESGVGEDVVLAYIRNAQVPFTLTARSYCLFEGPGNHPGNHHGDFESGYGITHPGSIHSCPN